MGLLDLDPRGWNFGIYCLYSLAVLYLAAFFAYFVRFRRARRRALAEGGEAVARYNRLLRGFPNGFYAKMFGHGPL